MFRRCWTPIYGEYYRLRVMRTDFSVLLEFLGGRNQIIWFIFQIIDVWTGVSVIRQWVNWMIVLVSFASISIRSPFMIDILRWDENWIFKMRSNWFSVSIFSLISIFIHSFVRPVLRVFTPNIQSTPNTNESIDFNFISFIFGTVYVRWQHKCGSIRVKFFYCLFSRRKKDCAHVWLKLVPELI